MLESLVRLGFAVKALSGTTAGTGEDFDPAAYLSARSIAHEQVGGGAWQADARGVRAESLRHYRLIFRGVPLCPKRAIRPRTLGLDFFARSSFITQDRVNSVSLSSSA
jgi:hypothetical protein